MNLFSRFRVLIGALLLTCSFAHPTLAQAAGPGWEELPRPAVGKGLMMEPCLLGFNGRCHLAWIGTSPQVPKPEVFHTSISGGSKEWSSPRAPFFGMNKGRVRKVALGRSRNLVALMFQRTLSQGNDAYEVFLSLSGDHGWAWGRLVELDSYVSDVSGGTAVSVAGREGPNRTEFTMAWIREFGSVRVANMDIKSELRPEGVAVGTAADGVMKADVGALGKDGFSAVFNNGQGLATAHARALIGKIGEATTFLRGRYGSCWTVASRPYGPSRLAVGSASTIMAYSSNETSWKSDEQVGILPFSAEGAQAQSDMDEEQDLHVALLIPKGSGYEVWYIGQDEKKWGQAELVCALTKDLEMRGFDIGVTDDYVFVAASQGYDAHFFRKKHRK